MKKFFKKDGGTVLNVEAPTAMQQYRNMLNHIGACSSVAAVLAW